MANVLANGMCFPVLIDHMCVFFGEIHVQILCPFFSMGFFFVFTIIEL